MTSGTDPTSTSDAPRKRRRGRPRTTDSRMTSVKLAPHDMALLEHVAAAQDKSFAEVWRSALHVYARELGVDAAPRHGEAEAA